MREGFQLHRLLLYLWPGLPSLWHRGEVRGLALALLFGSALNLLLGEFYLGLGVLSQGIERLGWLVLPISWGILVVRQSARALRTWQLHRELGADYSARFQDAQLTYLRRNWIECESLVRRLLEVNPSDVAARLLAVGVLRETERYDEAIAELNASDQLDGALYWRHELQTERLRVEGRIEEGGSSSEKEVDEFDATSESEAMQNVGLSHSEHSSAAEKNETVLDSSAEEEINEQLSCPAGSSSAPRRNPGSSSKAA